jgi:MraZ protein
VFAGSHEHSLDDKGRLVMPAQWRRHLDDGAFLAPWEHCLALFPAAVFWELTDVIQERIEQATGDVDQARGSYRYFMSQAREVSLDAGGRIVVPPAHRQNAGLAREALLVGMRKHIEVWEPGRWAAAEGPAQEALATVIRTMRL